MGEFTEEVKTLVKRYYLDAYGLELDLSDYSWHKIVGYWWTAQAHFGIDNFHFSLDDVEVEEGKTINIVMDLNTVRRYICKNGEWVNRGELTTAIYK